MTEGAISDPPKGERIAVVETRLDGLEKSVDTMALKVDVVLAELARMRGAMWALGGLVALASVAARFWR